MDSPREELQFETRYQAVTAAVTGNNVQTDIESLLESVRADLARSSVRSAERAKERASEQRAKDSTDLSCMFPDQSTRDVASERRERWRRDWEGSNDDTISTRSPQIYDSVPAYLRPLTDADVSGGSSSSSATNSGFGGAGLGEVLAENNSTERIRRQRQSRQSRQPPSSQQSNSSRRQLFQQPDPDSWSAQPLSNAIGRPRDHPIVAERRAAVSEFSPPPPPPPPTPVRILVLELI